MGSMACEEWFELVSASVDGELDRAESTQVEAHLAACPGCQALADGFGVQRRRLLVHPPVAVPDLGAAVLASAGRPADRRVARTLGRRVAVATLAASVLVVLGLFLARGGTAAPARSRTAALAASSSARPSEVISTHDHAFDHTAVEVSAGSTVEWRNGSGTAHRLAVDLHGNTLESPLAPGQHESVTFRKAGRYVVRCTIHQGMTGIVTVDA